MKYTVRIQIAAFALAVFTAGVFDIQNTDGGLTSAEAASLMYFGFLQMTVAIVGLVVRDVIIAKEHIKTLLREKEIADAAKASVDSSNSENSK